MDDYTDVWNVCSLDFSALQWAFLPYNAEAVPLAVKLLQFLTR